MELREVYKNLKGEYPKGRDQRISAVLSMVKPAWSQIVASPKEIAETLSREAHKRGILESMLDISINQNGCLMIDNEYVLDVAIIDHGSNGNDYNDSRAYYAEGRILARQERNGVYD